MVTLQGNKTRDINQLHDSIILAHPELKETMKVFGITGGTDYRIVLPDAFDARLVQTIIDDHVPTPKVREQLTRAQMQDRLLTEEAASRDIDLTD